MRGVFLSYGLIRFLKLYVVFIGVVYAICHIDGRHTLLDPYILHKEPLPLSTINKQSFSSVKAFTF